MVRFFFLILSGVALSGPYRGTFVRSYLWASGRPSLWSGFRSSLWLVFWPSLRTGFRAGLRPVVGLLYRSVVRSAVGHGAMFRLGSRLPLVVFGRAVSRFRSGKIFGTQLGTDTARTAVHRMAIAYRIVSSVEAGAAEMGPAVSSPISQVVAGRAEVKIVPVGIYLIDTEVAHAVEGINGAEEVFYSHEAYVFRIGKYPAEVVVAFVQVAVVGIQGAAVGDGDA